MVRCRFSIKEGTQNWSVFNVPLCRLLQRRSQYSTDILNSCRSTVFYVLRLKRCFFLTLAHQVVDGSVFCHSVRLASTVLQLVLANLAGFFVFLCTKCITCLFLPFSSISEGGDTPPLPFCPQLTRSSALFNNKFQVMVN